MLGQSQVGPIESFAIAVASFAAVVARRFVRLGVRWEIDLK